MKQTRTEPLRGSVLVCFTARGEAAIRPRRQRCARRRGWRPRWLRPPGYRWPGDRLYCVVRARRQQHFGETDGGWDLLDPAEVLVGGLLVVLARVEGCGVNSDDDGATP